MAHAESKVMNKFAILWKMVPTTRGANEEILKAVYQGSVRHHLDYGFPTWMSTAKTNQSVPDKVQNEALSVITGAMKSIPIKVMEVLTAVTPFFHSCRGSHTDKNSPVVARN